ncbi:zinc metalloproteinase nas-8-like [Paramacrobiotus metropolitanus]|uniref:zinc metalloproteinase nas-8-like n=1 Tax=Paramacrobiotus metropolitanus TaxID=2943436 RepID=UPI002445A638|nr:zinc metalloproteinase nas-8-like [Paramacrobiotus metropolitanus]
MTALRMFITSAVIIVAIVAINSATAQTDLRDALGFERPSARSNLRAAFVPYSTRHQFWLWPKKTITYCFDASYSQDEQDQMTKAMRAVENGVRNCTKFEQVACNVTKYKLRITPFEKDNKTAAKYCASWPGIYKAYLADKRKSEQRLVIARGDDGCMGTQHDLMKMFTISMGRRNEHQRHDRDEHLTVNMSNIQQGAEIAFRPHPVESFLYICNYDYCSVTHNQPSDFAKRGLQMFTVKNAPFYIPKTGRLSGCDCKELTELYGCPSTTCEFFDCESQPPPPNSIPAGPVS